MVRLPRLHAAAAALLSLTACTDSTVSPDGPNTASPSTAAETAAKLDLSGRTAALDPGHNGGNADAASEIARPVDDGRGGKKSCNTTGTATAEGFPEHEFTWKVTLRLKARLEERGATVILSRKDDSSIGPCVDERGRFADRADLLVSIHANGSDSPRPYGFGAATAPDRRPKASAELASAVVTGLKSRSFQPNPSYGKTSTAARRDLGGLNHARVPAVLIELGEMHNPREAAQMSSAQGQKRYAAGLEEGIARFLNSHPQ